MPITSTIQQGTLSLAAATPGNSAIGDTAAAGTSASVARADHKHGREASGTPGASAVGDTASAGSATTIARSDHVHGREAFGTPVNIDASVTSLSAGSLTTVARADHIHTVSKVPVLIASTTLSSGSTNVVMSSIPQTYSHLEIRVSVRSAYVGNVDFGWIRVNGDTAANYVQGTLDPANQVTVLRPPGTTNLYSSFWATGIIHIYDYASTTKYKNIMYRTAYQWNGTGGAPSLVNYMDDVGLWKNSASPITSVQFQSSNTAAYTSGSSFRIYGIP